jgi:hypothetical protein
MAELTVILGHDRLLGDGTQLDLDIDRPQALTRHVHIDQTRIHGFVELTESGDEPY